MQGAQGRRSSRRPPRMIATTWARSLRVNLLELATTLSERHVGPQVDGPHRPKPRRGAQKRCDNDVFLSWFDNCESTGSWLPTTGACLDHYYPQISSFYTVTGSPINGTGMCNVLGSSTSVGTCAGVQQGAVTVCCL